MGSKVPTPKPEDTSLKNISPLPQKEIVYSSGLRKMVQLEIPSCNIGDGIEEERYLTHCQVIGEIIAHSSFGVHNKIEEYFKITGAKIK